MISDDTIDITTAKCWCIFSDKKFRNALQKYLKPSKQANESIGGILGMLNSYSGMILTFTSLAALFAPYISSLIKKIRYSHDDAIAKIEFDADGTGYQADFNIKSMSWILTSNMSNVSQSDTISFFKTNFFKLFMNSCVEYIAPIVSNEKMILDNIDQIDDSSSKKFIKSFFKYKDRIMTNMINGHFTT